MAQFFMKFVVVITGMNAEKQQQLRKKVIDDNWALSLLNGLDGMTTIRKKPAYKEMRHQRLVSGFS